MRHLPGQSQGDTEWQCRRDGMTLLWLVRSSWSLTHRRAVVLGVGHEAASVSVAMVSKIRSRSASTKIASGPSGATPS